MKELLVTVGTTSFDELIETVLKESFLDAARGLGIRKLTLQVGNGRFDPDKVMKHVGFAAVEAFRYKPSLSDCVARADVVVCHGGAGTCLEVLELGKPAIVVVNEALMDNHQQELADKLADDGHLFSCYCGELVSVFSQVDFSNLRPFPRGRAEVFANYLDAKLFGVS
jgi:beta-1,4-N-acetylglucosaminyltransferase